MASARLPVEVASFSMTINAIHVRMGAKSVRAMICAVSVRPARCRSMGAAMIRSIYLTRVFNAQMAQRGVKHMAV